MRAIRRGLAGLVIGVFAGLAVVALVVLAKPPFLVDSPRSEHPVLLIAMVASPALVGALVGLVWHRAGRPR